MSKLSVERKVEIHIGSNQLARQYYILIDVANEISLWKSFNTFRSKYGDITKYPEYECWYERFSKGEFEMHNDENAQSLKLLVIQLWREVEKNDKNPSYSDRPLCSHQEVINHIRQDPIALKYIIFFDAAEKIPVLESYEKFSENYQMADLEFKFWYNRFSMGKFDMDYNESFIEDLEPILNELSFTERRNLQNISASFRALLATIPFPIKFAKISITNQQIHLLVDKQLFTPDFLLEHQNFTVDTLKIVWIDQANLGLSDFLKSIRGKFQFLQVKNLEIELKSFESLEFTVQFLALLDPTTLKNVKLELYEMEGDTEKIKNLFQKIAKSEQFEGVVELNFCGLWNRSEEILEFFLEFPYVTVWLEHRIFAKRLAEIIKTFVKSPIPKKLVIACQLTRVFRRALIYNKLGTEFTMPREKPETRRYQIPNSNEFFEVYSQEDGIIVERKSC